MLTARCVPGRVAVAAAVTALAVTLLGTAGQQQAVAQTCRDEEKVLVEDSGGNIEYQCPITGPGEEGTSGGGSGGPDGGPECDLSAVESMGRQDASTSRFCEGESACFINFPSAVYPEPADWPEGQPTQDSVYTYKACFRPDGSRASGEWGWFVPEEPSLPQLAWDAYGRLELPEFRLAFSPPEEALVLLDTWWWAEGPSDGAVQGSSAAGVVAIAEPARLEVDPGDGSELLDCPFTVEQSDVCAHIYERASTDGTAEAADGSPAYPARARLVYGVRFENDGAPLDLAGLPDRIASPWEETAVPVAEAQAVVVDGS